MTKSKPSIRIAHGIPSATVHIGVGAVAVLLSMATVTVPFWLIVALALAVAAAAAPRLHMAWALMVLLAFAQLSHPPLLTDWRPYVLMAGLHLLHVLASMSLAVPLRGRIALSVLGRTLRRYLVIQLLAQGLLIIVLALLTPAGVHAVWLAPVGAAALVACAATLVLPIVRDRE